MDSSVAPGLRLGLPFLASSSISRASNRLRLPLSSWRRPSTPPADVRVQRGGLHTEPVSGRGGVDPAVHLGNHHPEIDFDQYGNYELYDERTLGPFPADWHARTGRVVLTGEYGGKAGFRHVMDGIGIAVVPADEDLVFHLVRLVNAMTGYSLTEDELRLIATCPRQLALLFPDLPTSGTA